MTSKRHYYAHIHHSMFHLYIPLNIFIYIPWKIKIPCKISHFKKQLSIQFNILCLVLINVYLLELQFRCNPMKPGHFLYL